MSVVSTNSQSRSAKSAEAPAPDTQSPAERYQELFVAVQSAAIFPDSKTFVDCAPRGDPQAILAAYRAEHAEQGFDLNVFVSRHFDSPPTDAGHFQPQAGQPMADHIAQLWDVLTRHPSQHPHRGSLLQLPQSYVVPGGRFVEMYYWDSYFTMLGLAGCKHEPLLHAMVENFACLIDTYGHVPNGTRTYYLSRSQPPVFALMVGLCESCGGQGAIRYLPQLISEHRFWMNGSAGLAPGDTHRRVVALPDGALLNRYWDDHDTPREEAWREDMATAAHSTRPAAQVYRDLRAAAESGWDFSSRWLDEKPTTSDDRNVLLSSIRTSSILPVDLNALLHKLETTIASLSADAGNLADAEAFKVAARDRAAAMTQYLWNDEAGAFLDYDWQRAQPRCALNAATLTPLFTGTATQDQADVLAGTVQHRLLAPGGLATTESASGEQWDKPNGWAPLQWMAVEGLAAYGHWELAETIKKRWMQTVAEVFERESKLVEKYALRKTPQSACAGGGGGEYPLQDGFGWTNGVVSRWLAEES